MGWMLLVFSAILLVIFIFIIRSLNTQAQELGCFQDPGCTTIESSLSVVHFAFGIFGFLFALAAYLLFFSTGEEAIVKRLEMDTDKKLHESKFDIFLRGLGRAFLLFVPLRAQVVELADTQVSEACGCKALRVRLPPSAPLNTKPILL